MRFAPLLVLASLAATAALAAAAGPAPDAQDERKFLEQMSMHHMGAMDMARMVANKTAHPAELGPFAQTIISTQQREVEDMRTWLASWYGAAGGMNASAMDPAKKAEMDRMMSELEAADGAAFDQAFLRNMIKHHGEGIQMAEAILQKDIHNETRKLAEDIVTTQKAEIETMRAWQSEWNATAPVGGTTGAPSGANDTGDGNDTEESAGQDVPGIGLAVVIGLVGLAALARPRRR